MIRPAAPFRDVREDNRYQSVVREPGYGVVLDTGHESKGFDNHGNQR